MDFRHMLVWFRLHELAWEGQIMLDGRALPRVLTALAICKPYSNEKKKQQVAWTYYVRICASGLDACPSPASRNCVFHIRRRPEMRRRRRSRTNRNGGDAHGGDDATIGRARHLTRRGHAALQAIMRPGLIMHAFPKHLSFWLLETVLKSDPRPFKKKIWSAPRVSRWATERTNEQTNKQIILLFVRFF
jgi:hypothetical protein